MGGGNEVCDGQLERGSCGGIIELDFAKYVIFFFLTIKLPMIYQTELFPDFKLWIPPNRVGYYLPRRIRYLTSRPRSLFCKLGVKIQVFR